MATPHPNGHPNGYDWLFFGVLLVLNPVLFLLRYLAKLPRKKNDPLPPTADWPWKRAGLASAAFTVWALSVPGNPFVVKPGWLMLMWGSAVLASAVIGYLDKIYYPEE